MSPSRPLDAELLLSHGAWLARLARALVAKDDEVDDVVQQTYVQALVQPPRHASNLRGWLGAIARNVVRARTRSDLARVAREESAPRPSPPESPAEAIERVELRRAVVDAVLALAEPYRSSLVLRFFEELPTSEIARLTKSPQETVKTRVKRGLAQLREMLSERFSRNGESLMEGLAMLLVPSMAGSGMGGSVVSAATTSTTASGGGGVVAVGSGAKLVIAAAAALVVGVAAWRWTVTHRDARAPEPVAAHAAAPTPTTASEPPLAGATRVSEPASDPAAAIAGDASATEAATFDFDGRVVDARGAAVADALVLLMDAKSFWAQTSGGGNDRLCTAADGLLTGRIKPEKDGARGIRSGADGSFRFDKVDSDHTFELAALHETAGLGRAHAPSIDAKERAVITLAPMIVVRGRVTEVDGRVPAGAKVAIQHLTAQGGGSGGALPASDGSFRCFWTHVESLTLVARTEDGRESEKVKLDFGPNDPRERDVSLVIAATGGGRCHGRIVDKSGAPLKLREKLLPRLTDAERVDGGVRAVRVWGYRGESAPPQEFEAGDVVVRGKIDFDAATYDVVLSKEVRWIALVVRDRTLGAVAVSSAKDGANGPDLVVDLLQLPSGPAGTAVELRLLDAQSGALFTSSEAVVEFSSSFGDPRQPDVGTSYGASSRRRISGGIVTLDNVHPGHCTLTVEIDGMAPIRREFDVVARAEPYHIDLTVRAADAMLRGLVVDSDGKPLVKAHVRLLEQTKSGLDAYNVPPTLTNGEGRFIFEKLASGEGVLIVYALPFAPAVVPVKLAADGDAGTIALIAGGRIVVTVPRARGDPKQSSFDSIRVARTADGIVLADPAWEGSVDWKTNTRLELVLPAGKATLDVTLVDGAKLHREVEVVAGKTQEIAIE